MYANTFSFARHTPELLDSFFIVSITFLTKEDLKDGLDLNLDQMEQILKLFKEKDMNKNGKDDEIPLSFVYQNWQGIQCDLYGAFGCPDNVDHRTVLNGKVICTAVTD